MKSIKNDKTKLIQSTLCIWLSTDINNLGGILTVHCKKTHQLNQYDSTLFVITEKEIKPTWKCPICDWTSIDITNTLSGSLTTHIKKNHSLNILEFNNQYPKNKIETSLTTRQTILQEDYIECKICNKKMLIITNTHLKLHNITKPEYIKTYGKCTVSNHSNNRIRNAWYNNPHLPPKCTRNII